MSGKWAWLSTVVAIALVFAHPNTTIAGFIPPILVTIGALVAVLATSVIAVVDGLASKALNVGGAIIALIATFTGPEFGAVLPEKVTQVLFVLAAVVGAFTTMHPAAVAARAARARMARY